MPKFSKRHYEAVALAEHGRYSQTKPDSLEPVDFVKLFAEDNPKFDREKFLKACLPKEPKH